MTLSAAVNGTGPFSAAVTFSVNGVPGGNAANGTFVGETYTAPPGLPSPDPVTITATSVQDPTKSASISVTVFTFIITPPAVTVQYGQTQQFTLNIAGIPNSGVQWVALYGKVDGNGLYTAPTLILTANQTDTVSANVTLTAYASAAVTLKIPAPVITSIQPNGASANEPITINGENFYGASQIFFPGPNGTTLSPAFNPGSLTQIMTTLPLGTVSGPVSMLFSPIEGVTDTSNSIAFTRLPNLRIRAPVKDLSSSEFVQFSYQMLGASTPSTLTWTADVGTVSGSGLYQAPVVSQVSVPGGAFVTSRAETLPNGIVFQTEINQETMYVAGVAPSPGAGGLQTFDLSSGTPAFLGQLIYALEAGYAVQVKGTTAFLGLTDSLKTVDVTDPTNPTETASQPLATLALLLSGNTLFVGTADGRLVVLDVTNPNAPVTLGSVNIPGPAVTMHLAGTLLYIADGSKGLLIFDVSTPSHPVQLSRFTLSTPIWDSAPSGSVALLAADALGLVIADISNPSRLTQISQTTLESYNPFPDRTDEGPRGIALSVAVQDGIAYVGTGNSLGVVFGFDYSVPANPRLISMTPYGEFIDSLVTGFAFVGNDLYVVGGLGEFTVMAQADNSNPRNAINLCYPPLALRSSTFASARGRRNSKASFQHPKFDRSIWQRRVVRKSRADERQLQLPSFVGQTR